MKSKVDKRTGDDVREDVYDFTKGNHKKKKSLRMKEERMVIKEERMLMVGRTMTGEFFLLI